MDESPFLTIPSNLEKLEDVQTFSETIKDWAKLDDDSFAAVSLALNEAVTNAIRHGNKERADKKVNIQTKLDNNELHLVVKDEGEGFVPSKLPNPLAEENLLKPSGRGVYLMNQICDEVRFSPKGNEVTLIFKR